MASSNVKYYEKQKELQDILHNNEEKRNHLNQQLRTYWKSDERLAKLRVAKLQSYWKKICEDEKRSKQRNEQILKHFDRIEAHLSKVSSRTEKLRVLKEQYVDYIEKTYPLWVEQVLQWRQQKQASQFQEPSRQPEGPQSFSHGRGPPVTQPAARDQLSPVSLQDQYQEQIYQNWEPCSGQYLRSEANQQYGFDQQADDGEHYQEIVETEAMGSQTYRAEDRAPPQPFVDENVQRYQSAMYEDDNIYLEPIQRQYPEGQSHTDLIQERDDGQDISEQVSSINLSAPLNELLSQPVRNVQFERNSHTGERIQESTLPPRMMVSSPDQETDSEFGDIDLPSISGRQAPTPARQEEREVTMFNKQESVSNSPMPEIVSPDLQSPQHASVQRTSSSPRPELTAEGLGILLKYVENDIPEEPGMDGYQYYRSPRPSSDKRIDIIHKANMGEALGRIDAELVSMVILEQVTLVVRSLKAGCLLPDELWSRDTSQMGFVEFRSHLSSDAQPLWDVLFDHFTVLVQKKVMETKVVAAIFIPCLVEENTANQGKAFNLLVRLLESTTSGEDLMGGSPRDTLDSQINTARSSQTGGIPPLKFGSLLDRPFSDDESTTFFDQSIPSGPKIPLNETAAYQNLLSGTRPQQPQYQEQEEDTDDEMEKQFASVLSPRDSDRAPATNISAKPADLPSDSESPSPLTSPVYVPTAIATRSSSTAATVNKPAVKMPATGYKISSDSDSDMDIPLPGQRLQIEQDDDLEFYS